MEINWNECFVIIKSKLLFPYNHLFNKYLLLACYDLIFGGITVNNKDFSSH